MDAVPEQNGLTALHPLAGDSWTGPWPAGACDALEQGAVLHFSQLRFDLTDDERALVARGVSVWKGKNISLDPGGAAPSGLAPGDTNGAMIGRMMARFATAARSLVVALAPDYGRALRSGRTSFRPVEIAGRPVADWRADDTRLHIDAFPATPVAGLRLLRVFANVDPSGRPRIWRLGGCFEDLAARYLPQIRPPVPGSALFLRATGRTRSRRTAYDHYMLHLHDMAKADTALQTAPCQRDVTFGPAVWVVFSDQVPHAAMAGCNALETTFYLPPAAQRHPESSPLRILERLTGRRLAP